MEAKVGSKDREILKDKVADLNHSGNFFELANPTQFVSHLFDHIFNRFVDGIVVFDQDGKIINANQSFLESVGIEKHALSGQNFQSLIPNETIGDFHNLWQELFINGSIYREIKLLHCEETKVYEMTASSHVINDLCIATFRNITERRKLEDQLRKSDMLNVVGELAAGVAHEIRNPLTSLKGFIQLLKDSVDGYSMYFNIIMSELNRIETIVSEFLFLAKPQAVVYKTYNIVQIMQETLELLHAQAIMHNVQFRTKFKKKSIFIYCEPNQIKQVFINILKNAIEVMPGGGKAIIYLDEDGQGHAKVSIQDQGPGVSDEVVKSFGQPFYTTKERGTGLGLMVSYKIIREHGGKIDVESELGKGTVFHLFLPLNQD